MSRFVVCTDGWFDGRQRRGPATLKVVAGRLVGVAEGDHAEVLAAIGWPVQRGAFLMPQAGALGVGADFDAVLLEGSVPVRAWSRGVETVVPA